MAVATQTRLQEDNPLWEAEHDSDVESDATSDEFPVDARSLHAKSLRDIQVQELRELETRASEVDRALQLVDQEIQQLEYQASLYDAPPSTYSTYDAQRSTYDAQRSTYDAQRSTYDAQRSTYDSPNNTSPTALLPYRDLNAPYLRQSQGDSRVSATRSNFSMPPPNVVINNFHQPVGRLFQHADDERMRHDGSMAAASGPQPTPSILSNESASRDNPRTAGGNVFRDISEIARERAEEEDKNLLVAIKASIGFAAAMIGEALFVNLREWLKQDVEPPSRPIRSTGHSRNLSDTLRVLLVDPQDSDRDEGEDGVPPDVLATTPADSHPAVQRAKSDQKLKDLVRSLKKKGQLHEAELLLKRALDIRRQKYGDEHPAVAHSLNQLGSLLSEQGKLDEAEPMFQQSLDICRNVYPDSHPREALLLNNMAVLLLLKANRDPVILDEAVKMGQRAAAIALNTLGPEHPMTLAYREDWSNPTKPSKSRIPRPGALFRSKPKLAQPPKVVEMLSPDASPVKPKTRASQKIKGVRKSRKGVRKSCVVQ